MSTNSRPKSVYTEEEWFIKQWEKVHDVFLNMPESKAKTVWREVGRYHGDLDYWAEVAKYLVSLIPDEVVKDNP
jgi:hypothetical protein